VKPLQLVGENDRMAVWAPSLRFTGARMTTITKYSIVCQVPDAKPYTFCEYTGVDLDQVLGITQVADTLTFSFILDGTEQFQTKVPVSITP